MTSPVVITRIQNRRGSQEQLEALYPPTYEGIGGYNDPDWPGFTEAAYPNVLMPGEIALCTDTRRVFMGNINGEYVELTDVDPANIALMPLSLDLVPSATFIPISELTYEATPFMTIPYSMVNPTDPNWNNPGTSFSRNGQLQITSVKYVAAPSAATLTDTGTEINFELPSNITFIAEYDVTETLIEIKYMHNFPSAITFSSSSIIWLPF